MFLFAWHSIAILVNNAFKTVQQSAKDKEDICRRADARQRYLMQDFTLWWAGLRRIILEDCYSTASWFLEQSYVYIFFHVVVKRRSHRYASFLRLAEEEIILRQYSRNLIFAVLVYSVPASWFLEQSYVYIFYFRVVVKRRSHRYAFLLRLEIRKFILQDWFKNQLVGTLVMFFGR